MPFKTEGWPQEAGWYVFQHKNTGELIVRELRGEEGVLYGHNGTRYDHASQWREYYSGWIKISF